MDAAISCFGFAPNMPTEDVRRELTGMFREFLNENRLTSAEFVSIDCPLLRRDIVVGLTDKDRTITLRTDAPFLIETMRETNVSVMWPDIENLSEEHQADREALFRKYGQRAMSVRLAPKPYVSNLSVGSDEPKCEWRARSAETLWKCQVFGVAVQKLMFRLHKVKEPKVWLSDLQTSCLSLIATGLSVKTTATVFSLTERRVLEHLDNAQKRLNAHSHSHAVAKAIALGLIAA